MEMEELEKQMLEMEKRIKQKEQEQNEAVKKKASIQQAIEQGRQTDLKTKNKSNGIQD
jgi:hypothetical protein